MLLAGHATQICDEIEAVEICKQFGWTYENYLNAPLWFLGTIKARNKVEARLVNAENKKIKRIK